MLKPYYPNDLGAITAFTAKGCTGGYGRYEASENLNEKKYYNMQDLTHTGGGNNSFDAVMVPFGYTVEMWKDNGFVGEY